MKPWDSLTDVEKREAIALRLGWTDIHPAWPCYADECGDWNAAYEDVEKEMPELYRERQPAGKPNGDWMEIIPGWPTNDGLAFVQVWPVILKSTHDGSVLGLNSDDQPSVKDEYCCRVFSSTTWADAAPLMNCCRNLSWSDFCQTPKHKNRRKESTKVASREVSRHAHHPASLDIAGHRAIETSS